MINNRIERLENDQGQDIMDHDGMEHKIINYYKDLLIEPCPDRSMTIHKINHHIPPLIIEEQNEALL
jgi:hypothetical protein